MTLLAAIIAGVLFGSGLYLMMRRSIMRLVLGLILLSHAANIVVFTAGGLVRGAPPIVPAGEIGFASGSADPVPQALILTAIVIGLGLQAFLIALVYKTARRTGTEDLDDLKESDAG